MVKFFAPLMMLQLCFGSAALSDWSRPKLAATGVGLGVASLCMVGVWQLSSHLNTPNLPIGTFKPVQAKLLDTAGFCMLALPDDEGQSAQLYCDNSQVGEFAGASRSGQHSLPKQRVSQIREEIYNKASLLMAQKGLELAGESGRLNFAVHSSFMFVRSREKSSSGP